MKLNHKGFTLIESIITFAILTLAGGMFLLGFYNVSVIASEGSLIKSETNTLYADIVGNNDVIENISNITIHFSDGSEKEINGSMNYKESSSPFTIRLSKFVPNIVADRLPDEIIDVPEPPIDPNNIKKTQFYLLGDITRVPSNYTELQNLAASTDPSSFSQFFTVPAFELESAANISFEGTHIFGEDSSKYILKFPSMDDIRLTTEITFDNYSFPITSNYKNWLGDQKEYWQYVWICIEKGSVYDSEIANVYGYLINKNDKLLLVNTGTNLYFINLKDKIHLDNDDIPNMQGSQFLINGTVYHYGELKSLKFMDDFKDQNFYSAVIKSG